MKKFSCKARKTEALKDLSRAYDKISDKLHKEVISLAEAARAENNETEAKKLYEELYWGIPNDLHLWKPKHSKMFSEYFPELCAEADSLAEMRKATKEIEIEEPKEKIENPREAAVYKTIKDEMEARKASYVNGLNLSRIFGGMSVSANSHYVTNRFNNTFPRTFFYLNGKLTALDVIIAIAEKLESEKEK